MNYYNPAVCPHCGSLLQLKTAYLINDGGCSCPTGECHCNVRQTLYCPRCESDSPLFVFLPKKKNDEEDLPIFPTTEPWMGDKLSNQRFRNPWNARKSIVEEKRRWKGLRMFERRKR